MSAIRSSVRFGATVRRVLVARPWLHWLAVGAVALAVAATVNDHVQRLAATRARWGESREVLVAAGDLAAGAPLAADRRSVPVAVLPDDPVDSVAGVVAAHAIGAGSIITGRDVVGAGPLALAPPGWLVAPVEEVPASGAAVGERVQVVADGLVIGPEAVVVGRLDGVTLVAAPPDVAPLLPAAASAGALTLLRRP